MHLPPDARDTANAARETTEAQDHLWARLMEALACLRELPESGIGAIEPSILAITTRFLNASKAMFAYPSDSQWLPKRLSPALSKDEAEQWLRGNASYLESHDNLPRWQEVALLAWEHFDEPQRIVVLDPCMPPRSEATQFLRVLTDAIQQTWKAWQRNTQLLQMQRVAIIGQVAAGALHEINNPLSAVIGAAEVYAYNAQHLMRLLDEYEEILSEKTIPHKLVERYTQAKEKQRPQRIRAKMVEHYEVVRMGAERVRTLIRNIRSFAHVHWDTPPQLHDLDGALEETLALAHNTLKYGIRVERSIDKPLPIRCDVNAIKHVLLNIILNAAQAMNGSGQLAIEGRRLDKNVVLSIADNGPGIPDALHERVFDTFFTTRKNAAGLGLSIVKAIMSQHGGSIDIESDNGHGTLVRLTFPQGLAPRNRDGHS